MPRIVIVGGVAGGMSAAARARRLDEHADIIVLERGPYVSFANCGLPYFVGGEIADADSLLLHTPDSLRATLDLDVRTNHDVTAIDTAAKTVAVTTPDGTDTLSYDSLILSPGAFAARPPVPGLDSPRVHTLRTVDDALALREGMTAGAAPSAPVRVVVLGAGFIGVEAAEAVAGAGADTTVVEFAEHVLPPLDTQPAHLVQAELARLGVTVRTSTAATAVVHGADHDTVELSDGSTLPADLVVLSVGVRPDTAVVREAGIATERDAIVVDAHGRTSAEDVWAVGDAVVSTDAVTGIRRPVALAGPANRAGRQVATAILAPERARPLPNPVGTAIVRVGELTAAMTGANLSALEALQEGDDDRINGHGLAFHTIDLHPMDHAGYFPGAAQIHLRVHFATDGTLLGAQAVGAAGVDKRIDVLATAIRAGLKVQDLVDLDLAYSPPYGQAKDAVNLAGMLGTNVLDGTMALWHARDLEAELGPDASGVTPLVLDVRSSAEFATGHLPGALNIPHTQLRGRLDEVRAAAGGADKTAPIRVMCASGVRSAIAYRVLVQEGFDVKNLSGGMISLRAELGDSAARVLTVPAGV